jgi:aminopeptidase N
VLGAALFLWLAAAAAEPSAGLDASVLAYDVVLRVDREARQLTGHERITVRSRSARLARLRFPRNGLSISAVHDARGKALAHVASDAQIEITLDPPLARGASATLALDYVASEPKGVRFDPEAVYTIFHTCHWMVCREDPGERAAFALTLEAPEGLTVVASGAPAATTPAAKGWERHVWTQTLPYPAYLFAFALGRFQKRTEHHKGVTLEYYVVPSVPADQISVLSAPTRAALDFFREHAGLRLPHAVYRQVVVAGDAAQEASSFSILGWDGLEPMRTEPQEDWLIAHELAHQYWGNLLTCAEWKDFWLNEGLTTFLVAAYKEKRWGRDAYERELALFRTRRAKAAAAGFDVPLTFAGDYPSLAVKRAVVYSKGALFLAALRERLGERAFWAGLRRYTRSNAGRSVTSADFQRSFEKETRADLSTLFAEWVY